jgi:hypothetical protein
VPAVLELGFLQDSYSVSEQMPLNSAMVCVVINRGILEREVVVDTAVTDMTADGKELIIVIT